MSPDVLRSLARVLRFTHAERTHLFTLAGTPLPEHDLAANAELHRTLAHLFSDSRNVCAFARDPWFNVTAATSLATSVFGVRPGRGLESNLLYRIFDDPLQQQLWVDWESEVRMRVGMLRQALAQWPAREEGQELLKVLERIPSFASIWNGYDVRSNPSPDEYFREEPWELEHPKFGTLRVHRIAMTIPDKAASTLVLTSPGDPETCAKFQELAVGDGARPPLFLAKT